MRNALAGDRRRRRGRPRSSTRMAEALPQLRGREAPSRAARQRRRHRGLRRLRAPSDRRRRDAVGAAPRASERSHLGDLRAALGLVVPARVPGRLRRARWPAPTKWCWRTCSAIRCPTTSGCQPDELVQDLRRARASRRATPPLDGATSSTTVARETRDRATRRRHVERRLRRHPRQAARARSRQRALARRTHAWR